MKWIAPSRHGSPRSRAQSHRDAKQKRLQLPIPTPLPKHTCLLKQKCTFLNHYLIFMVKNIFFEVPPAVAGRLLGDGAARTVAGDEWPGWRRSPLRHRHPCPPTALPPTSTEAAKATARFWQHEGWAALHQPGQGDVSVSPVASPPFWLWQRCRSQWGRETDPGGDQSRSKKQ